MHANVPSNVFSRTVDVLDSFMLYREVGEGEPIVFIHGNPTSSYLWRNILPSLAPLGRCIAVDLIGMGESGKPPIDYRLVEHAAYLGALIAALDLRNIRFVLHDWGVALGLNYARRFPDNVKAIAFMEGHIKTIHSWDDFDEGGRSMFQQLRTVDQGRQMVIEDNFFIEAILPGGTQRTLTDDEMNHYRAPYLDTTAREPLWRWPNEIPIGGQPADVHDIVAANNAFLTTSSLPKLLLYATPGAIIDRKTVAWCETSIPNLATIHVGAGTHFLPEDQPDAIGSTIAAWLGAMA